MKTAHAILALIVLSVSVHAGNEKSPNELYAERLAAAERKKTDAEIKKMWEQRVKEEADAAEKRHEEALRRESPEARVKRERENQRWEAERAAHESWCAEHPAECAQAEADRQREQAEQAGAAQKRGEIALARVEWELAARRRNALLAQADPFVALQNALAGRRAQTPSLLDLISQQAKQEKAAAHAQLLAQISQQAEAAAYALKTQLEVDQKRASAQPLRSRSPAGVFLHSGPYQSLQFVRSSGSRSVGRHLRFPIPHCVSRSCHTLPLPENSLVRVLSFVSRIRALV